MKKYLLFFCLMLATNLMFAQESYKATYHSTSVSIFNSESGEITPLEGENYIELMMTLQSKGKDSIPDFIRGRILIHPEKDIDPAEAMMNFEILERISADVEYGQYSYLGKKQSPDGDLYYQILFESGWNGIERIAFIGDETKAMVFDELEMVE